MQEHARSIISEDNHDSFLGPAIQNEINSMMVFHEKKKTVEI
jgi:hypothetical protein